MRIGLKTCTVLLRIVGIKRIYGLKKQLGKKIKSQNFSMNFQKLLHEYELLSKRLI